MAWTGPTTCKDCDEPWPLIFMVKGKVWREICGEDDDEILLCQACAEERLGRPLAIQDLMSARCNDLLRNWCWRGVAAGRLEASNGEN